MIPFIWVDPTGLNSVEGVSDKFFNPGSFFEDVTGPMFPAADYADLETYSECGGVPMEGSESVGIFDSFSFREVGISYYYAYHYNRENGLSKFSVEYDGDMGYLPGGLLNVNQDDAPLSDLRWVTPHNPIPHPLEGVLMHGKLMIKALHDGTTHIPKMSDLMKAKCSYKIGVMRLGCDTPKVNKRTVRYIPPKVKMLLETKYSLTKVRKVRPRYSKPIPHAHADNIEVITQMPPQRTADIAIEEVAETVSTSPSLTWNKVIAEKEEVVKTTQQAYNPQLVTSGTPALTTEPLSQEYSSEIGNEGNHDNPDDVVVGDA
jgi:hypothetical protein